MNSQSASFARHNYADLCSYKSMTAVVDEETVATILMNFRCWPAVALGAFSLAVMRVDDRLLEQWQAAPDSEETVESLL